MREAGIIIIGDRQLLEGTSNSFRRREGRAIFLVLHSEQMRRQNPVVREIGNNERRFERLSVRNRRYRTSQSGFVDILC